MTERIPDSHRDLIDGPVYVVLTTMMPDGQPQSSVIWCNRDGDHVLVNSTRGRQKSRNMDRNPKVTLLALDPDDPDRYLEIRGIVESATEEGAVEHIDQLARLYTNEPGYYGHYAPAERRYEETRVIYRIRPTRVRAYRQ